MKTHSGEKSNKCNQCDYASSQTGHLITHMKTHRGEKLNKCNQCEYASSQASNLRQHFDVDKDEDDEDEDDDDDRVKDMEAVHLCQQLGKLHSSH